MIIASRSPHYAPAGYVPVGMDATVADDSLDFAFTNPFTRPVYIYTEMGDASVTVYILGNHADTCNVTFNTVSQKTLPHRVVRRHDDKVTEDKRDQEGYDGHDITIAVLSTIRTGIIIPIRLYPTMTLIRKSSSRRAILQKKSCRRRISTENSLRTP